MVRCQVAQMFSGDLVQRTIRDVVDESAGV